MTESAAGPPGSNPAEVGPDPRPWQHLAPGVEPAVLARVLAAMPDGLHPAEIEGFLTRPNPNVILDDRIVTVVHYLAAGGDVELVAQLAADLDAW